MTKDEAKRNPRHDQVAAPGKLFIGGLPEDITEEELTEYFSKYGPVESAQIIYSKTSHKPRGFGFVYFGHYQQADCAVGQHNIKGKWVSLLMCLRVVMILFLGVSV
eukprot:GHVR01012065.1.p2 GENE.GHVR01012065.1~~GHVR01012065.1.p2  ORF type:complete len:106 (+),score=14.21 GHVR01012065.1:392-709(+)